MSLASVLASTNPTALWRQNDSRTSTQCTDSSGNGFHLAKSSTSGNLTSAFPFGAPDMVGDGATCAYADGIETPENLSLTAPGVSPFSLFAVCPSTTSATQLIYSSPDKGFWLGFVNGGLRWSTPDGTVNTSGTYNDGIPHRILARRVLISSSYHYQIYVDGILDGDVSVGASVTSVAAGIVLGGFQDNFGGFALTGFLQDVAFWNRAVSTAEIASFETATTPINPHMIPYTITDITLPSSGSTARILVPYQYNGTTPTGLVIFFHGAGFDCTQVNGADLYTAVTNALCVSGYIVASVTAGNSSWGNSASADAVDEFYSYLKAHYNILGTYLWPLSMGNIVATNWVERKSPSGIYGVYDVFGVFNLANMYNSGSGFYATDIQTAYNFSGPSGYAAATAGFDPNLASPTLLPSNIRWTLIGSYSDTTVDRTNNMDLFVTQLGSITTKSLRVLTSTGGHGDITNVLPADVVQQVALSMGDIHPVVSPSASPSPTTSTTTTLNANASSGTSPYTYAWTCTAKPSGTNPLFSNTAVGNPTVTFNQSGSYTFHVVVTDNASQTVSGDVSVTVNQTLSTIAVSPLSPTIVISGTQTFTAVGKDQFDIAMTISPTWSVVTGIGTIDTGGIYTAPATMETDTVRATSGSIHGDSSITVVVTQGTNIEQWVLTNTSSQPISFSLNGFGTLPVGQSRNLFSYATKEQVLKNEAIYNSLLHGNVTLTKYLNGNVIEIINSTNAATRFKNIETNPPILTYSKIGETTQEAALRQALASLGLIIDNTV